MTNRCKRSLAGSDVVFASMAIEHDCGVCNTEREKCIELKKFNEGMSREQHRSKQCRKKHAIKKEREEDRHGAKKEV